MGLLQRGEMHLRNMRSVFCFLPVCCRIFMAYSMIANHPHGWTLSMLNGTEGSSRMTSVVTGATSAVAHFGRSTAPSGDGARFGNVRVSQFAAQQRATDNSELMMAGRIGHVTSRCVKGGYS